MSRKQSLLTYTFGFLKGCLGQIVKEIRNTKEVHKAKTWKWDPSKVCNFSHYSKKIHMLQKQKSEAIAMGKITYKKLESSRVEIMCI